MADLTDFGVDVGEEDDEEQEDDSEFHAPSYNIGRCPCITSKSRRRCKAPISRMNVCDDMCGVHGRESNPWRIDDSPEKLVQLTGARSARCRAIKNNGDRCTNSCGPTEYRCGTHSEVGPEDLVPRDQLEDDELHAHLIREALRPVQLLHEGTLPVVEGQLWLPREIQHAAQIVVRQRDVTSDWRSYHREGWVNWVGEERNRETDDPQNPHLDPLEVSVKVYSQEAEIYPVVVISE